MSVSFEQLENASDNVIAVTVSSRLTAVDYDRIVPALEKSIQENGKIRLLVVMKDFHGWEPDAVWQDLKFDAKHFADVERVAVVGDKRWEKWLTILSKSLTAATVRYFDFSALADAKDWIRS